MHAHNYLGVVSIFVCAAFIVQLIIIACAPGGIDINVYWNQSVAMDFTNPRYYHEPVSWIIIKFLSGIFDRNGFLLSFGIILLMLGIFRLGLAGGAVLYASLLSPFGIMMALNVLRQCLGSVFLLFFILSIVNERRKASAFWGMLAILSHNSTLIFVGAISFLWIFNAIKREWKTVSLLALAIIIVSAQLLGGLDIILGSQSNSVDVNVDGDGIQNALYFAFAMIFCGLLHSATQQEKWRPIAIGLAAATIFSLVIAVLLSMDAWVYGRVAITTVFCCHFLLLFDAWEVRRVGAQGALFLCGVVVINGTLTIFHPGAMSMIFGLV